MSKVAIDFISSKLHSRISIHHHYNQHSSIGSELAQLRSIKPSVTVINRNGVEIFVTVDKRVEWERKRISMLDQLWVMYTMNYPVTRTKHIVHKPV